MSDIKLYAAKAKKILLNPPALRNCSIDDTARVCSGSQLNSTELGRYSYIGNNCFSVNAKIGSFCSIADNCRIGGASHPYDRVSTSPVFHSGKNILKKNFSDAPVPKTPETVIENDVWLGAGCIIKSGITIHNGAVVGAGSVVTHDIPPYEIWAGNPARKIKDRFDKETTEALQKTQWWNFSDKRLAELADKFCDVEAFINEAEQKLPE